jgi:hypothetical protein
MADRLNEELGLGFAPNPPIANVLQEFRARANGTTPPILSEAQLYACFRNITGTITRRATALS